MKIKFPTIKTPNSRSKDTKDAVGKGMNKTQQAQQKAKRTRFFRLITVGMASLLVFVFGLIAYFNQPLEDEAQAYKTVTSSLSTSELQNIRSQFQNIYGLPLVTLTGDQNLDTVGGALDYYFNTYDSNTQGRKAIANTAEVNYYSDLAKYSSQNMSKFLLAARYTNNGEYSAVYDVATDSLQRVAAGSNSPINAVSLISRLSDRNYYGLGKVSLQTAIQRMVDLGINANEIEQNLNYRKNNVKAGNLDINVNSGGSVSLSGDVIFPDVFHVRTNTTKNDINTKLAFVNGNDSIARFDILYYETSPNNYTVMLFVRNGESMIYSDGRLSQTTRWDYSEAVIEPAWFGTFTANTQYPELSVEKECFYNNNDCKSANVPTGATVEYIITVENTGSGNAERVIAWDDYPESYLDVTQIYDNGRLNSTNTEVLWSLGDLSPGAKRQLNYRAQVESDAVNKQVYNKVTTQGFNTAEATDDYYFYPTTNATPNLSITKDCRYNGVTCRSTTVPTGATVDYILTVRNSGAADATNVRVWDNYPEYYLDITNIEDGGSQNSSQTQINWNNLGTLQKNGGSREINYRARVKDNASGQRIDNTAYTQADGTGIIQANYYFYPQTQRAEDPIMRITKTCSNNASSGFVDNCGTFEPGATVYYRINVEIDDADANNVRVTDSATSNIFNGNLSNFNVSGNANDNISGVSSNGFTWNLGDMQENANATLTYRGVIRQSGSSITNGRNVDNTANGYINNSYKVQDDADLNLRVESPILQIFKSCLYNNRPCENDPVPAGSTVDYTIRVENNGNGQADNVDIVDTYPYNELNNPTDISNGGSYNSSTHQISWNDVDISANSSVTRTFRSQVKDGLNGGNVYNFVRATLGSQEVNASHTFDIEVIQPGDPILKIAKGCKDSSGVDCANLAPGTEINYTLTIWNDGETDATDVTLVDDYPEDRIDIVTLDDPQPTDDGDILTWDIGTLPSGGTEATGVVRTYTGRIKETGLNDGDHVRNVATVSTTMTGVSSVSDYYDFIVQIDPSEPVLEGTKECFRRTDDQPCNGADVIINPGDEVKYVITVTNSGDVPIENVAVNDDYPEDYLENLSFETPQPTDNGSQLIWDLGTIDNNTNPSRALTYYATVKQNTNQQTISNLAIASGDEVDDVVMTTEFVVGGAPNLSQSSKECIAVSGGSCSSALPGDWVRYTIYVRNTGNLVAENVHIVDTYDLSRISEVRNLNPAGISNITNGTISWGPYDINAGDQRALVFEARISPTALNGRTQTTIVNNGVITANNLPTQNVQHSFTIRIIIDQPTTRTGGTEIFLGIAITGLAVGIGYYIYNNRKFSKGFAPARSKEKKL